MATLFTVHVWYGREMYGLKPEDGSCKQLWAAETKGCVPIAWHGMAWHGMAWYDMTRYGVVWCGMVWYGMVLRHLGQFALHREAASHRVGCIT